MGRFVVFLRGINVSGQKLIRMEELRQHFVMASFSDVRTYIQSGNVLFSSLVEEPGRVREIVEKQLLEKLGYPVTAIVRTAAEINDILRNSPFLPAEDEKKPRIYVSFLSHAPGEGEARQLEALSTERERLRVPGKEVYLYTDDYGGTKFSNTFIEKKLGVQGTVRNWNTLQKIGELMGADGETG